MTYRSITAVLLDDLLANAAPGGRAMSDRQVAQRGGPSAATLRLIRRGHLPRRDSIARLARVLGLPFDLCEQACAATVAAAANADPAGGGAS